MTATQVFLLKKNFSHDLISNSSFIRGQKIKNQIKKFNF